MRLALATSTVVCANRLRGDAFTASTFVQQLAPPDRIGRPIVPITEEQLADLAITLGQPRRTDRNLMMTNWSASLGKWVACPMMGSLSTKLSR